MKIFFKLILGFVLILAVANSAYSQISQNAIRQIESLNREKEARTPVQKKIDSKLLYAAKQDRGEAITPLVRTLEVNVNKDARGLVAVDIKVTSITKTLLTTILNAGGEITFQSARFKAINAKIPLQAIERVAASPEVLFIYPADKPFHNSPEKRSVNKNYFKAPFKQVAGSAKKFVNNFLLRADEIRDQLHDYLQNKEEFDRDYFFIGSVTSEGDVTHRASEARSAFGVTGAGVKIGVLSNGVAHLAASQASGDLGPVTVLPGQAGNDDEGTAMLEVIHDLAPGAQLYFATASGSQESFAQNILDLRAAGCDIIVDDVTYNGEAVFQDGVIAQAVNTVTAAGALYFSSAGNAGNKDDNTSGVWEGDFNDAGTGTVGTVTIAGGTVHNFSAGTSNNQLIAGSPTGSAKSLGLFWSDPLGGSGNDYDLYLLNAALTAVLSSSTNIQDGNDDPVESAFIDPNVSNVGKQLVIFKKTGAAVRALHLNTNGGKLNFSTQGQTHGHSAAIQAYSVAATPAAVARGAAPNPTGPYPNAFNPSNLSEIFTSDGPRRMFYNADSTAITPGNLLFATNGGTVRQKPDITAADGVSNTGPGDFETRFFGTSAAAPHAAAIAALLKSGTSSLTPAQIRSVLTSTAIDIETPGVDRNTGAGIVMAYPSLQAAGASAQPVLQAGSATITAQSCAPANGVIDPGETVTVNFCIQNIGAAATTNLVGTLQNTSGVINASGTQNYGAVPVGATQCRPFSFTASGTCGSTITASINFQDGAKNLGTLTYTFTLGVITQSAVATNTNNTTITIPDIGTASPYPSNITVSGLGNTVSKVTVRLNGLSHAYPPDLSILLVSPAGQKVILMSGAGGGQAVVNANLIFDDAAASLVPGTIPSNATNTYKPTDFGTASLPAPAPTRPYAVRLSAFNGFNPNGTWKLYVSDGSAGDGGSVTGGWTLNITTSTVSCCSAPPPVINAPTVTQPTCTTSTGTIVVNATGSGTLEYSINNGASYQLSNTFSSLTPGSYNISVRLQTAPSNSTTYSGNPVVINVQPPTPATPTVTVTQPNSNSATGTITVNTPTGTDITYSINNVNYQASNVFSNVAPGNYNVTAKNTAGCVSAPLIVTINAQPAVLVAASTTITAQSCMPVNGVIDPGETVTVSFCIQNNGGTATTSNLTGTLQNTGGVSGASTTQNYGAIAAGGSACRSFSFTANGSCGGTVTASINLQDGATNLGTITYNFTLGVITQNPAVVTTNSTAISISTGVASPASPYPSNIVVSGITNPVSKVTVQLNNFNHTYPRDLNILLVSPTGQKVMLMSFAGGDQDVVNANLVFDDAATSSISNVGQIPSNTTTTYKPTDYGTASQPAPAPVRPYGTMLSSLNGLNPNGTWSLYVADAEDNDGGSITGGWTLNIITSTATCCTGAPVITAPTVTQPACTTPTGTIVVNATGSGTLEYSIDNGANWQLSNTFSGLLPGNYTIRVRQQANPAISTTYSGNPVTINAAPAPVVITTASVARGAVGAPYSQSFAASGGNGHYTYSLSGTLPAGLRFADSTINGTPAQSGSFPVTVTVTDPSGCPAATRNYTLIIAPSTIAATAGTPQTAYPEATFSQQLQVLVKDSTNTPLIGVRVIFTAPATGASGTFANGSITDTVTTNSSGIATADPFRANSTTGSYTVTASVAGIASPATFSLSNTCPATYVVTSSADNGPGTLRAALGLACPDLTVTFDPTVTQIVLTSGDLMIYKGVTINGPGAAYLSISGNSVSRVFNINAGSSSVSISGLTIRNGKARTGSYAAGGGVVVYSGMVNLSSCYFLNNNALDGGAIDAESGTVTVNSCTLTGNTAVNGGGLNNFGGNVTITNSTITANTASGTGGGISTSDATTVTSSTFFGNTAANGGNIAQRVGSTITIGNTIVAGGTVSDGGTGPDIYTNNSFTSGDYNLIQNTTGYTSTGTTTHNLTGLDPQLLPLNYRASVIPVLLQQPNSPVINAGNPAITTGTDERGYARVAGAAADIGAVEALYAITPVSNSTPQSTSVNSTFPYPLSVMVRERAVAIKGISVTYTAPAAGASGTFPGNTTVTTAVSDTTGLAQPPAFTANGQGGSYVVTGSIGPAFTSQNFYLTNVVVLPVVFGNVSAQVQDCAVQLQWTTLSETSAKDYTIEYSTDGIVYNGVVTIPAKGTGSSTQSYSYTHVNPANGTVYYRIRQTDKNGAAVYTKVMAVLNNCSKQLVVVRPNPVQDRLTVQIGGTAKQILSIYDATGRKMIQQTVSSGTYEIGVKNWAKGIYTLTLIQDGKATFTTKLVKE